jgi:hypothetical protein
MRLTTLIGFSLALWWLIYLGLQAAFGQEPGTGRVGRAPLLLLTARFSVGQYVDSAPRGRHTIAILWDVPRRRRGNLRAVFRRTKAREVQIVLLNETCVRNRVCEKGDALHGFTPATFSAAVARADSSLRRLIKRETRAAFAYLGPVLKDRAVMVNPLLETQLRRAEWNRVARWVQAARGPVPLVFNPVTNTHQNKPSRATYTEHHGLDVTCSSDGLTIANLDGSRCSPGEMRNWLARTRRCRLSLLWEPADNCRLSRETRFVPPSKRFCGGDFNVIKRVLHGYDEK